MCPSAPGQHQVSFLHPLVHSSTHEPSVHRREQRAGTASTDSTGALPYPAPEPRKPECSAHQGQRWKKNKRLVIAARRPEEAVGQELQSFTEGSV